MGHDLGKALKSVLPAPDVEMLKLIAGVAETQRVPLFAVGGLPRDLALGRMPSDCDLVVEGSAAALAQALVGEFGGTFTAHSRFGTVQWHLEQSRTPWGLVLRNGGTSARRMLIDLISARSESYARPAALPQVAFGSIEDDLRRRDFTINTLALRLDGSHYGEVLDPLHAMGDLKRCLIRALHEGSFRDYGGEEFGVLLRATALDNSVIFAERVWSVVEHLPIEFETQPIPGTVSVGVASMVPVRGQPLRTLTAAADRALYRAKEAGRNRVVAAGNESVVRMVTAG